MAIMSEQPRSARRLWQDYAFLTREMGKMLLKQDLDLFLELMDQRERIQASLDALPEDDFKASPEGRELLTTISQHNKTIAAALQRLYNNTKHRQQVARAYDSLGTGGYVGIRMDRQS
ncbi:hypothetical protein SCACP_31540 [Sporomusa carbonis]|uniref:hypothetical protein n=1 Tax=Sporomusa carbonis TaxID=3076075 RepID=UPI003A777086